MEEQTEGERGDLASAYLALAGSNLSAAARDAISGAGANAVAQLAQQSNWSASIALSAAARDSLGASATAALGHSELFESASALSTLAIPSEALDASRVLQLGSVMADALKGYKVPDVTGLTAAMRPLYGPVDTSKLLGDLTAPTSFLAGISESMDSALRIAELAQPTFISELADKPSYLDGLTGMSSILSQMSEVAALRDEQFTRLVEPLHGIFKNVDLLSGTAFSNYNFMDWVNRPTPVYIPPADPVEEWLERRRADLPGKRQGMWFAIAESPDPVSQACNSAVELLLQLFSVCGVTPRRIASWASGTKYYEDAVDTRQRELRATWRGRLRFAATLAGFDELGQDLAASLADAPQLLQDMKHQAHRYTVDQVEAQLQRVEEILRLFAGRI